MTIQTGSSGVVDGRGGEVPPLNTAVEGKSMHDRDALEAALGGAPVIARLQPSIPIQQGTRSSAGIDTVILEGDVHAIFKIGCEPAPGQAGARREVAAYVLARAIGFDDLVGVAALRRELDATGKATDTAAIEFFDDRREDAPLSEFPRDDIERAGVFDAIIGQPDRSHNWLAVPAAPPVRLKLFDHELAFQPGTRVTSVQSRFWDEIGRQVPSKHRHTVSDALAQLSNFGLRKLLSDDEYFGVEDRLRELRSSY